jgi:hypothetical protein
MPTITRLEGCPFDVGRVSDDQLNTSIDFASGRDKLTIITVTAVDAEAIEPTRLVIGDTHSIWITHQVVRIPPRSPRRAVVTGLTAQEAETATALFRSLARDQNSAQPMETAKPTAPSLAKPEPVSEDRVKGILTSIRNHPVIAWLIVLGVIIVALAAFAESISKLIGILQPK